MQISEELDILEPYITHEKDRNMFEALRKHKTISATAKKSGYAKRTISRRLAKLRKEASRFGYNSQYPQSSIVTDMPAHGRSVLQRHDPPLPDGTLMTWHKTRAEDTALADLLKAACQGINIKPAKPRQPVEHSNYGQLPIITLADCHLGLLAAEEETGHDWNLDKAMKALMDAIDYLVDKMDPCETAVLCNLGDLTHTDGLVAQTPRSKNPLDASNRYFDIARAAGELVRYAIEAMLDKAQVVQVYMIRGNHDDLTSWHLCETLRAVYDKEPRVLVAGNDTYHQQFSWGKNFVVMTHGDAAKNSQMYQYITAKWPREFGLADYTYVMKGHIHHMRQEAIGNAVFETFSTLTRSDAYHEFKMYKSLRAMSMVTLDIEGGEGSRITYTPRAT